MSSISKKVLQVLLIIAIFISGIVITSNADTSKEQFNSNQFNVLEIVPDKAYAEIGYLVEGEEPVDLTKIIKEDNLGGIGSMLGDAITITGEKTEDYKIVKDDTVENTLISSDNIITTKGYYKKENKGEWQAVYSGELTTGYIAESWENDNKQEYNLKWSYTEKEYINIDSTCKGEVYRFDKESDTYVSRTSDIKNKIDISEFDYAYIAMLDSSNKTFYELLTNLSDESFRKISDCKVITSFVYVGKNSGEWNFYPAFDKRIYNYNNQSGTWDYKSESKTKYANTYLSLVDDNADCGVNTLIKGQALSILENPKVTKVGYKNNNLLKESVHKDNINVITRIPSEITEDDIYKANIIYINCGGKVGTPRYEQIAKLYLEANPSYKISKQVLYNYNEYNNYDKLTSAIMQRAVFGTETIQYDSTGLEIIDTPATVIFDSELYKGITESRAVTNITKNNNAIGFNTGNYASTTNDFVKLYMYMNIMYPTVYYKNYTKDMIASVDESTRKIDITLCRDGINTGTTKISGTQAACKEIILPKNLEGVWGDKESWALMGIDNPDLDAPYVAEHGVLTFSSLDGTLLNKFTQSIIPNIATTEEVFDNMNITDDSTNITDDSTNIQTSLDYLVNHQIRNNIPKNNIRILEIEPCEAYTSMNWNWKLSGLSPYYTGTYADWYSDTGNTYSTYGQKSRRLGTKKLIGLQETIKDNYDMVYIGSEVSSMSGDDGSKVMPRENLVFSVNKGNTLEINIVDLFNISDITLDSIKIEKEDNESIINYTVNGTQSFSVQGLNCGIASITFNTNTYCKHTSIKKSYNTVTFKVVVTNKNILNINSRTTTNNNDINLLDTDYETGYYEILDKKDDTSKLRCKNEMTVSKNCVYKLSTNDSYCLTVIAYDKDNNYIGQYINMQNNSIISFSNNVDHIVWYINKDVLPNKLMLIQQHQKTFTDVAYTENDFTSSKSIDIGVNNPITSYDVPYKTGDKGNSVLTNTGDIPGYIKVEPNTTYTLHNFVGYEGNGNNKMIGLTVYTYSKQDLKADTSNNESLKNMQAFKAEDKCSIYYNSSLQEMSLNVSGKRKTALSAYKSGDTSYDIVLTTGSDTEYITLQLNYRVYWMYNKYTITQEILDTFCNDLHVIYDGNYSEYGGAATEWIDHVSYNTKVADIIDIRQYVDSNFLAKISDLNIKAYSSVGSVKVDGFNIEMPIGANNMFNKIMIELSYNYREQSDLQKSVIILNMYRHQPISDKVSSSYITYYNDETMNGLIYTHIGDIFYVSRRIGALSGAINKDGTTDISYDKIYKQRLSGNDITAKKIKQLQGLLDSGLPIIVNSRLVNTENGKIASANDYTVDNSSNLYYFINDNKDTLIPDNSTTKNIFKNSFDNIPIIEFISTPLQYNSNNEQKYLTNNKLEFTVKIKNTTNNVKKYKARLFIDINCDGNYSESEEIKGLIVTDSNKNVVGTSQLEPSVTGCTYKVSKVLNNEYKGALVWKLIIEDTSENNIEASISGCSAIKTKEQERAVINVLQIGASSGKGTFNMETDKEFLELVGDIDDFKINIIQLSETSKTSLANDDVLAYEVTCLLYKDSDYKELVTTGISTGSSDTDNDNALIVGGMTAEVSNVLYASGQYGTDKALNRLFNYGHYTSLVRLNDDTKFLNDLIGGIYYSPITIYGNTYYTKMIVKGLGFSDIEQYNPNIINQTSDPQVKHFDMIIIGFEDSYVGIQTDATADKIAKYINSGYSVLLSHDLLWYNYIEGYRSRLLIRLRDAFGMDRYKDNDIAWMPKTNRQKIDNTTALGFNDIALVTQAHNGGIKEYNSYNKSQSTSGGFVEVSKAEAANRGQITDYPYTLPSSIKTSATHAQYWSLDLEDPEVGVWYTLSSKNSGSVYDYTAADTRNAFYIYNKGNITYTGIGHSAPTYDEKKLFVNTIIQSFKNSAQASKLIIDNSEATIAGNDTYIYIDEGAITEGNGSNQKLKFHMEDTNILSDIALDVTFADFTGTDDSILSTKNFDSLTKTIYFTESGDSSLGVYKYEDDINNAQKLEISDTGKVSVKIDENYYILIPEDVINWAIARGQSTNSNSYTLYVRIRMTYSTKAGVYDDEHTKVVEGIQRIIFVKRQLFMFD